MINLDNQFSIILDKFKLIENSLNNMNDIESNELIKLNFSKIIVNCLSRFIIQMIKYLIKL